MFMHEIKCPACKAILAEPLPKSCPVCHLKGINQMFLTREDYDDWKKHVLDEHIKNLRPNRISAGYDGILILLGDGRLFGFGNNTQGQYCPCHIGEKIEKPEKIADGVISAAAGYNYSLYLDTDGKIHFLGNSGIPFKERFTQGDLVLKEVYAKNDIDIFGAEDIYGNFYIWGDNHSEQIEPIVVEHIMDLETIETQQVIGKLTLEVKEHYFSDYARIHFNDFFPLSEKELEYSIKMKSDYKSFSKLYSEYNLEIHLEILKSQALKIIKNRYFSSGGPFSNRKKNVSEYVAYDTVADRALKEYVYEWDSWGEGDFWSTFDSSDRALTLDDLADTDRMLNWDWDSNGEPSFADLLSDQYSYNRREDSGEINVVHIKPQIYFKNAYIFKPNQTNKASFEKFFSVSNSFSTSHQETNIIKSVTKDNVYANLDIAHILHIGIDKDPNDIFTLHNIDDIAKPKYFIYYFIDSSKRLWKLGLPMFSSIKDLEKHRKEIFSLVYEF